MAWTLISVFAVSCGANYPEQRRRRKTRTGRGGRGSTKKGRGSRKRRRRRRRKTKRKKETYEETEERKIHKQRQKVIKKGKNKLFNHVEKKYFPLILVL